MVEALICVIGRIAGFKVYPPPSEYLYTHYGPMGETKWPNRKLAMGGFNDGMAT